MSFEDVALKFLDAGQRDPLRSYLISRLERTRKNVSSTSHVMLVLTCTQGPDTADDARDMASRVLPEQMQ